ncbi:MAG: PilZ domain-containing protein [Gammaproteobacteria bacterium]|nr:PilZ domain-containing protein [Gammaproteobacteria bacterium]
MQQEERREFERFPYPGDRAVVEAEINWPNATVIDSRDVQFVDISRAGLGILSRNVFAVGDSLKLTIKLAKTEPLTVTAVVCNRRQAEQSQSGGEQDPRAALSWRYGLYFDYDVDTSPHAQEVLARLDEEVRRFFLQPV